jgi:hypothetical protein
MIAFRVKFEGDCILMDQRRGHCKNFMTFIPDASGKSIVIPGRAFGFFMDDGMHPLRLGFRKFLTTDGV